MKHKRFQYSTKEKRWVTKLNTHKRIYQRDPSQDGQQHLLYRCELFQATLLYSWLEARCGFVFSRTFLQQSMTCVTPHTGTQSSACRAQPSSAPLISEPWGYTYPRAGPGPQLCTPNPQTRLGLSVYKAMQTRFGCF